MNSRLQPSSHLDAVPIRWVGHSFLLLQSVSKETLKQCSTLILLIGKTASCISVVMDGGLEPRGVVSVPSISSNPFRDTEDLPEVVHRSYISKSDAMPNTWILRVEEGLPDAQAHAWVKGVMGLLEPSHVVLVGTMPVRWEIMHREIFRNVNAV